jgi:hypothetical protein
VDRRGNGDGGGVSSGAGEVKCEFITKSWSFLGVWTYLTCVEFVSLGWRRRHRLSLYTTVADGGGLCNSVEKKGFCVKRSYFQGKPRAARSAPAAVCGPKKRHAAVVAPRVRYVEASSRPVGYVGSSASVYGFGCLAGLRRTVAVLVCGAGSAAGRRAFAPTPTSCWLSVSRPPRGGRKRAAHEMKRAAPFRSFVLLHRITAILKSGLASCPSAWKLQYLRGQVVFFFSCETREYL